MLRAEEEKPGSEGEISWGWGEKCSKGNEAKLRNKTRIAVKCKRG